MTTGSPLPSQPASPALPSSPPPPPEEGARNGEEGITNKYEELLATAKLAYNYEWVRIDATESKAARFVPVVAILLGFNAAGLQLFVPLVGYVTTPQEWAFLGFFAVFSLANLYALWFFISALAVAKVMGIPADTTLPDLFKNERYVDMLHQMSDAFFSATRRERQHTAMKIKCLIRGYRGLVLAIIAGVGAVASYVMIPS